MKKKSFNQFFRYFKSKKVHETLNILHMQPLFQFQVDVSINQLNLSLSIYLEK